MSGYRREEKKYNRRNFYSLIKELEKKMIEKIMGKIGEEEEFS